jgi:MoaA/NifB/PqqE/SkfB family radical SAM enzyme
MCHHSLESTRRTRTVLLSPDDFSLIAASVLPHSHRLSLSLGNEPLMSPHFISILRIAASYEVPNVNFFTNGLLLNDEKIDAIIENGVTRVCVSIDGATPSTYNAIRRGGNFHRLVRNVKRLVARRNAARCTLPRVRFHMIMMQHNVHEMVDLVKLAARLGVQELNFCHLISFEGLHMEKESLYYAKELSNYWLERALAKAAELGVIVPFHPVPFDLGVGDGEAKEVHAARIPYLPTPYCPYPFFHVSMGPGGHVLACPFSHGQAPYGQLLGRVPFERVWLGPKFTRLRQRILRHDPPEMCRRCSFLSNSYPNVVDLFTTRRN